VKVNLKMVTLVGVVIGIALGWKRKRRTGARASVSYETGIRVDETVRIQRSPEEVYRFWRSFENLPRFMKHLRSVDVLDSNRSRWVVRGPGGKSFEWEAEVINEREPELIAWRSLPGSDVDHAGSVRFDRAPDGGCDLKVSLQYNPPGGKLGAMAASFLGEDPNREILGDLYRLKDMLESEGRQRAVNE